MGRPALAGIKAANLISFAFARYPALPQLLTEYGAALGQRDICLDPLACCKERCLLLVYRRAVLWRHLSSPQILAILLQAGYQVDGPPETLLAQLRRRLADGQGFPHEIGAFLGYPPQDVKGFLQLVEKSRERCGQWRSMGMWPRRKPVSPATITAAVVCAAVWQAAIPYWNCFAL